DLGRMYQLVLRIPNGLGELKNRLEAHITSQGLSAIERCGEAAVQDPRIYVSTILQVHKKFSNLVQEAFLSDSGFVAALDKVNHPIAIRYYFLMFFLVRLVENSLTTTPSPNQ